MENQQTKRKTIEKKRFWLRNEYFGGLLHDIKDMNAHILGFEEYELIKDLQTEQGRKKATEIIDNNRNEKFQKIISMLQEKGALNPDLNPQGIRFGEHPIEVPQGVLASPLRVYDTFGYKCNLHCSRCLNDSARENMDIGRRTIKQTEKIMTKFYAALTPEWRFTGGESTYYDDFIDAVEIAKGLGMGVMLTTNGVWSEKKVEKILNSGINEIIISIEGPHTINDMLRGNGVYDRIMETIASIVDHNKNHPDKKILGTLNMTIGKQNYKHIGQVVDLAIENHFNFNIVPCRPYGRADLADLLTTGEFMEFSRDLQKQRERAKPYGVKVIHKNMDLFNQDMPDKSSLPVPFNYSNCGALGTGFGLSPDGRVNACSFLAGNPDYSGKNLLDDDVTVYDAWLDPKMDAIRKAQKVGCSSGKCDYYMKQCEGKCVAMVLAEGGRIQDGKLIGKDRYCFKNLMPKEIQGHNMNMEM